MKSLFSIEGLKNNIGNYMILLIITINVCFVIIFLIKGFGKLYNIIYKILPLDNENIINLPPKKKIKIKNKKKNKKEY